MTSKSKRSYSERQTRRASEEQSALQREHNRKNPDNWQIVEKSINQNKYAVSSHPSQSKSKIPPPSVKLSQPETKNFTNSAQNKNLSQKSQSRSRDSRESNSSESLENPVSITISNINSTQTTSTLLPLLTKFGRLQSLKISENAILNEESQELNIEKFASVTFKSLESAAACILSTHKKYKHFGVDDKPLLAELTKDSFDAMKKTHGVCLKNLPAARHKNSEQVEKLITEHCNEIGTVLQVGELMLNVENTCKFKNECWVIFREEESVKMATKFLVKKSHHGSWDMNWTTRQLGPQNRILIGKESTIKIDDNLVKTNFVKTAQNPHFSERTPGWVKTPDLPKTKNVNKFGWENNMESSKTPRLANGSLLKIPTTQSPTKFDDFSRASQSLNMGNLPVPRPITPPILPMATIVSKNNFGLHKRLKLLSEGEAGPVGKNVHIINLSAHIFDEDIDSIFSKFGIITYLKRLTDNRGKTSECLLSFTTEKSANEAIKVMNNKNIKNSTVSVKIPEADKREILRRRKEFEKSREDEEKKKASEVFEKKFAEKQRQESAKELRIESERLKREKHRLERLEKSELKETEKLDRERMVVLQRQHREKEESRKQAEFETEKLKKVEEERKRVEAQQQAESKREKTHFDERKRQYKQTYDSKLPIDYKRRKPELEKPVTKNIPSNPTLSDSFNYQSKAYLREIRVNCVEKLLSSSEIESYFLQFGKISKIYKGRDLNCYDVLFLEEENSVKKVFAKKWHYAAGSQIDIVPHKNSPKDFVDSLKIKPKYYKKDVHVVFNFDTMRLKKFNARIFEIVYFVIFLPIYHRFNLLF